MRIEENRNEVNKGLIFMITGSTFAFLKSAIAVSEVLQYSILCTRFVLASEALRRIKNPVLEFSFLSLDNDLGVHVSDSLRK